MAARKNATAAVKAAVEHVEDICRKCWPNGWPHQHTSASCEHGTYAREGAETPADTGEQASKEETPETPEEKTPAGDSKTPEDTAPAEENTGS